MPPLYEQVARRVLPSWEISLAFVDSRKAKQLNKRLRGKDYVPNVLSYEVGPKSGEVIICPTEARKQAQNFGMRANEFSLFLFIHALLHLKGMPHGTTMERREEKLLEEFKDAVAHTHAPTHHYRNRHRHLPGKDSRRRRNRG